MLRFVDPPLSAFMVARQFEAWGSGDFGFRIAYDWRDLDEISSNVPVALVAAEDQNFAEHNGFDLKAIEKARKPATRAAARSRGASTISQQTAKNLFLWSGRSWVRKGIEAWYTVLIEAMWPKRRILEVYANIAEFGDGIYGAQAARAHFLPQGRRAPDARPKPRAWPRCCPIPRATDVARPGPTCSAAPTRSSARCATSAATASCARSTDRCEPTSRAWKRIAPPSSP